MHSSGPESFAINIGPKPYGTFDAIYLRILNCEHIRISSHQAEFGDLFDGGKVVMASV